MRVWLDDVRVMPEGFDVWVTDALSCAELIESGKVTYLSFDHDLGDSLFTGYTVACIIESLAYYNKIDRISWDIHSQNPVGRENIGKAMRKADEYWELGENKNGKT